MIITTECKFKSILLVMKRIIYIISLSVILTLTHLTAQAVTEQEMDQARTIAAMAYLRYANDGSGYLDAVHVKTMAELEKNLKQKEKENIKAFKAIPVPSDYKSWDKQKLVDYWGGKAFSTPGLLEKGRIGRTRAKKNINAMSITPPSKEVEKPTPVEAAAPAKKDTQPTAKTESPKEDMKDDTTHQVVNAMLPDSTATDALARAEAAAEAISQLEDEPEIQKADNHTWVYIVVLCVLIAVVCALVVFASNVMKRNGEAGARKENQRLSPLDSSNSNAMREKFAAILTSKNEEIKALSKKIEGVNAENSSLKGKMDGLAAEIASLRNRLAEANLKIANMQNAAPVEHVENVQHARHPQQEPVQQTVPLRTIYLGRANAKGIFVRADRTLNIGNSIYRLDTTDGYAGSFRVANDPAVWEMALQKPVEMLSGGSIVAEGSNVAGVTKIVNDSSGTAIFEDGCWKVIRKAKIHFE